MSVNCRRRNFTFSRSARSRIFAFCGAVDEAGGFAGMLVALRFLRVSHEFVHALQKSRAVAARLPLETCRVYLTSCTPSPESPLQANRWRPASDRTRRSWRAGRPARIRGLIPDGGSKVCVRF